MEIETSAAVRFSIALIANQKALNPGDETGYATEMEALPRHIRKDTSMRCTTRCHCQIFARVQIACSKPDCRDFLWIAVHYSPARITFVCYINMARTSTMLTFCIFALANLPALAKPMMKFPFLGPVDDGAGDQCHAEDAVSQCNLAISADGVLMDCRHWCWPALLPEKTAADFDATGCGVRTFGIHREVIEQVRLTYSPDVYWRST